MDEVPYLPAPRTAQAGRDPARPVDRSLVSIRSPYGSAPRRGPTAPGGELLDQRLLLSWVPGEARFAPIQQNDSGAGGKTL